MKISVCMATYNGGKFIGRQLSSILGQLSENDEVVISDDSSTDDTLEIIGSFNDNRIFLYPHQTFRNPILNFEYCLTKATGDYIFLSDQDDIWSGSKVAKVMAALGDCDMILSDCRVVTAQEEVLHESFFKLNHSRQGFWKNLGKNSYLGCCMAFRKEILFKALPFPPDIPMHDWWLGMVAEAFFKVKFLDEPLVSYRRHGINFSPTGQASKFSYLRRAGFRFALLKGLLKRAVG